MYLHVDKAVTFFFCKFFISSGRYHNYEAHLVQHNYFDIEYFAKFESLLEVSKSKYKRNIFQFDAERDKVKRNHLIK